MDAILMIRNISDDLDINDLYADLKIYRGDDCMMIEYGCILGPVPEKKKITLAKNENVDYILGWNACIDTILGGENATERI